MMKRALALFVLWPSLALGQAWQVPVNTIPYGKGQGVTGFGSVANTGTGSLCLLNTVPPSFGACSGALPTLNSGRIFVGNGSNVATAVALSGDCTLVAAGTITCTKTNNVSFGSFATNTDAANLTGTVASARVSGSYTGITALGTLTGLTISSTGTAPLAITSSNATQSAITNTITNSAAISALTAFGDTGNSLSLGTFGTAAAGNRFGLSRANLAGIVSTGTSYVVLGSSDSIPLILGTNDTERARILSTGLFGIGTTAPTNLLSVGDDLGAVASSKTVAVGSSSTNSGFTTGQDSTHRLAMAWVYNATPANSYGVVSTIGTLPLALQSNGGNVGIGTTTPAAQLHTTGTVRFAGLSGVGSSGCLANDTSGNITAGAACSGTGFPSGGVKGDLPYYSAAGTGAAIGASDANIIIQGASPSGGSDTASFAVLAYNYSRRVVLPPAPGGTTGVYKFSTNTTFPVGTELIIPCGVVMQIDDGITVRNNGVTKAGKCQIVTLTGTTGKAYLGRDVIPDWWPSTGGDDTIAINAADASTVDAAAQGADGTRAVIRLSCKTYTIKTAIILHASSTNPQDLIGCGDSSILDPSSGAFARGVLTQNGQTAGGGTDLMSFKWENFAISCSADQNVKGIALGTTGNAIRAYTKNVIERVRISNCRTGIFWTNTRLVDLIDLWINVRGDLTSSAAIIQMDFDDDNQFNGDSDIIRGQFSCASNNPTGGLGYGIRMKSERAGSNTSGIRVNGAVFYECNKMVYATWASTGTMGDHWFLGGGQCEVCGTIADYSGNTGTHKGALLRFDEIYQTNSGDMQFTNATIDNGAGSPGTTLTIPFGSTITNGPLQVGFLLKAAAMTTGTIITNVGTCGGSSPALPCTATVNNSQNRAAQTITANTTDPKFRFDGGNTDEIIDVSVRNIRVRGCNGCRFMSTARGGLFNIQQNQIATFNAANSSVNELIELFGMNSTVVMGNNVEAGISNAIPYLVTADGSSDKISVIGNMAKDAVINTWNPASVTNFCVASNLPSAASGC